MNIPFVFFGTSRFSVILLEDLKNKGIVPTLIITAPDRPVGRKQVMTASPVKEWAIENDIDTIQPEKLKDETFQETLKEIAEEAKLFIVASYGKIIPQSILDIPEFGTLNVHPSVLPKYRGASPIQTQILNDEKHVGTTIMLMDAEMDHGNIVAQKELTFAPGEFPARYSAVEERLAHESATILTEVLPRWVSDFNNASAETKPQDHDAATFTTIIEKADGEIRLEDDGYKNYLKYLAYDEWPKTFFFSKHSETTVRVKITEAVFENGVFIIKKVIPEGKKEVSYQDFLN
jgi:methionyl-tRNA formyltransferase